MTADAFPAPQYPDAASDLDKYFGPNRTTPEQARAAWANVTEKDFTAQAFTSVEHTQAIELLAAMCGLVVVDCNKAAMKSLRSAARYLLNNITLDEATVTAAKFLSDPKNKLWWKEHGKPTGAATTLATELARAKSQDPARASVDFMKYVDNDAKEETREDIERAERWAEQWR